MSRYEQRIGELVEKVYRYEEAQTVAKQLEIEQQTDALERIAASLEKVASQAYVVEIHMNKPEPLLQKVKAKIRRLIR